MKTFAFIFAREGSKGLPDKNIKLIGGIPLISHSIKLAEEVDEIDEIFVSTNSEEIKRISQSHNCKVIDRPSELATDNSPEWLSWQHAISFLQKDNINFDCFISLPATSPLRSKEDVISGIRKFKSGSEFVISITPSSRNPSFNMVSREKDSSTRLIKSGSYSRRQDAPEIYDITTVFYITNPKLIMKNDNIFAGRVDSVIIPKERAIDIDDEIDFLIAETLYERNE